MKSLWSEICLYLATAALDRALTWANRSFRASMNDEALIVMKGIQDTISTMEKWRAATDELQPLNPSDLDPTPPQGGPEI